MTGEEKQLVRLFVHRDVLTVLLATQAKATPDPLRTLRGFSGWMDSRIDSPAISATPEWLEAYRAEVDFLIGQAQKVVERSQREGNSPM